jgi:serine protease Do
VVNNITPPELLRGYFEDQDQPTSGPGDLEEETLAEGQETDESEKTGEKETGAFSLEEFDNAVNEVAEEINSSVVNVMVTIKQYDIFGQEYLAEGLGSGVIYDDEGYIITNNHVAGEAEDILVTLYDGSEYPAELKGADENTDIAVIKIEADDLNAASFASIDTVKVGDFVIAVGSPFGLQQTVTTGVISAKGRDITVSPETLPMVNLVQTDAAINSGNSGGPLVSAGIGFDIPSDTVLNMAEQIIKFGRVKIPYIGVEMGENNTDIVGVYINDVPEGYPASEAGIRDGDIITKFDGVEVKTSYELFAQILKHNVGDEVGVEIYRDGDYFTLTLKLVENPVTQESS